MRVLKQRIEGRHRGKKDKILFSCITILNLEAVFRTIAIISVTSTNAKPFDTYKPWPM